MSSWPLVVLGHQEWVDGMHLRKPTLEEYRVAERVGGRHQRTSLPRLEALEREIEIMWARPMEVLTSFHVRRF